MLFRSPGMDGVEATRRIRAEETDKRAAIIAVSASAMEEQRMAVLEYGADGFIPKPYREKDVFAELHRLLGVRFYYDRPPIQAMDRPAETDAVEVQKIPSDFIGQIRRAVQGGYREELLSVMDEIGKQQPQIGWILRKMAEEYRYEQLLEILGTEGVKDTP